MAGWPRAWLSTPVRSGRGDRTAERYPAAELAGDAEPTARSRRCWSAPFWRQEYPVDHSGGL